MKVKYRVYNYYGKVMAITTNKNKAIKLSKTLNGIVEAFRCTHEYLANDQMKEELLSDATELLK